MALIRTFVPASDGFTGRIKTILLEADLTVSVLRKPYGETPLDFLITLGKQGNGSVVGAARGRRTDKGGDFIVVRFDDLSFGRPNFASLFLSEHTANLHNLYGTRPYKQEDRMSPIFQLAFRRRYSVCGRL